MDCGSGRSFRVDLHDPGASLAGHRCQRSCGLDHTGSADNEKELARRGRINGRLDDHRIKRLSKPDNMGAQQAAAAPAGRQLWCQGQRHTPISRHGAAYSAAHLPDVAVQFQQPSAASLGMQSVNVLSNEREPITTMFPIPLQHRKGGMARIRQHRGDHTATPVVPFPHKTGFASERARRGQFFGPVSAPEAIFYMWGPVRCSRCLMR